MAVLVSLLAWMLAALLLTVTLAHAQVRNLARDPGVVGSLSSTFGANGAHRAFDGDANGFTGAKSVAHTNNDFEPWLQVDLGSRKRITEVLLYNRTDTCCVDRMTNFYVLVSERPFPSNKIEILKKTPGVYVKHFPGRMQRPTRLKLDTLGRYVRVQLPGPGRKYLNIAEIGVFGDDAASGPKVVSIHRHSPREGVTRADRVIWRVTFDKPVRDVDPLDFVPNPWDPSFSQGGLWIDTRPVSPTGTGLAATWDVGFSGRALANYNRNLQLDIQVNATINDAAGNALSNRAPTSISNAPIHRTYTFDNASPVLAPGTPTFQPDGSWRSTVTVTEANALAGGARLVLRHLELANATAEVTGSGKGPYQVTLRPVVAKQEFSFGIRAGALRDEAGNDSAAVDPVVVADLAPPRLVSITRASPQDRITRAERLTWRLTFNKPVDGLKNALKKRHFSAQYSSDLDVKGLSPNVYPVDHKIRGPAKAWYFTAGGKALTGFNGDIRLFLSGTGSDIIDAAGTSLANTAPTDSRPDDATYTRDSIAPVLAPGPLERQSDGRWVSEITVTEANTLAPGARLEVGDLELVNAGAELTGAGKGPYQVALTPRADGAFSFAIRASALRDAAGNDSAAVAQVAATATNRVIPRLVSLVRHEPQERQTRAERLTWRLTFNKPVDGPPIGTIVTDRVGNTEILDVQRLNLKADPVGQNSAGRARVWDVSASGANMGDFNGNIRLFLSNTVISSRNITDAAGAALDDPVPTNSRPDDATYTRDSIAPVLAPGRLERQSDGRWVSEITVTEANTLAPGARLEVEDLELVNAVAEVTGSGKGPYQVALTPRADGAFSFAIRASALRDAAGNDSAAVDPVVVAGLAPPRLVSITRHEPQERETGAERLTWRLTFNNPVKGFRKRAFVISYGGGVLDSRRLNMRTDPVGQNSAGLARVWEVSMSGASLRDFNGDIRIDLSKKFIARRNITDLAGAALDDPDPTDSRPDDATYTRDTIAPVLASGPLERQSDGRWVSEITVAEANTLAPGAALEVDDLELVNATAEVTGAGKGPYQVALTPIRGGAFSFAIRASALRDAAGNDSAAVDPVRAEELGPILLFTSTAVARTPENTTATGYRAAADVSGGTWPYRITYAIPAGPDAALFSIDATSGMVSFREPPNYERPMDGDSNNAYRFEVEATATALDGSVAKRTRQSVEVTITDADDPTVFGDMTILNQHGLSSPIRINDELSVLVRFTDEDNNHEKEPTVTLQWHRNGQPIPGATEATYTTTAADAGRQITVEVQVTDSLGNVSGKVHSRPGVLVALPSDSTAPTLTSILRHAPSASPTNADLLVWRITFSEAVDNVTPEDFTVGGTTATVTAVWSRAGATTWDLTVAGSDLADLNATVTLALAPGQDIADAAGNRLTDTRPTGTNENSYILDNIAPVIAASPPHRQSDGSWISKITVTEANALAPGAVLEMEDLQLTLASAEMTGSGKGPYEIKLRPVFDNTPIAASIKASALRDAAGNDSARGQPFGVFDPSDITAPRATLSGIPRSLEPGSDRFLVKGPFTVTFTFDENVRGFESADVSAGLTGATVSDFVETTPYRVFTATITPTGTRLMSLALREGAALDIIAGNPSQAVPRQTVGIDRQAPGVRITGPALANRPFAISYIFDEPVVGFDAEDVRAVLGDTAEVTNFTRLPNLRGRGYRFTLTPRTDGEIAAGLLDDALTDYAGNSNIAIRQIIGRYDATAPAITLSALLRQSDGTWVTTARVTEANGLAAGAALQTDDLELTNATAEISGDGPYTITLTPVTDGAFGTGIRAGALRDAAGNDSAGVAQVTAVTRPVTLSQDTLDVDEAGGRATYTIVLASRPAGDVTVRPASGDTDAATLAPAALIFTPANWDRPQMVTVTGVDDDVDNPGDAREVIVTHTATGGGYDGVEIASLTLTIRDDDAADSTRPTVSITRAPDEVTTTRPFTVTVTFSEAVSGFEAGDVDVSNGAASPPVQGSDVKTYTVAITPDGTGDLEIGVGAGVARDAAGNPNVAADPVTVPWPLGVTVAPQSVTVAEDGGRATYTIRLASQPTENVTLTPTSNDTTAATVSGPLTFTPQNWSATQTVTVSGINDDIDNASDRTATITHAVSGGGYGDVAVSDVSVRVIDDEMGRARPIPSLAAGLAPQRQQSLITINFSHPVTIDHYASATEAARALDKNLVVTPGYSRPGPLLPRGEPWTYAGDNKKYYTRFVFTVEFRSAPYTIMMAEDRPPFRDRFGNHPAASNRLGYGGAGDTNRPTVTLAGSPGPSGMPWDMEIILSKPVVGFDVGDFEADGAQVRNLTEVPGWNGLLYRAEVTGTRATYSIRLPANAVYDAQGNGNEPSLPLSLGGIAPPRVAIEGAPAQVTDRTPFDVRVVFSREVTGFTTSDLTVVGGTAAPLVPAADQRDGHSQDLTWTVTITPAGGRDVLLDIAADAARDINGNPNVAADTVRVPWPLGVTVAPQSVTVAEDGGRATYTIRLASQPTENVTLTPTSNDTTAATVSGPLTFTPQNWSATQTVTVSGVNDDIDNASDRATTITHAVTGGGYDKVRVADVGVTVTDVDTPDNNVGVPVFTSAAAVRTPENGVATGYGAVATADPGTLSYAITGGADAARFAIDASSGVVTFRAAPDYEAPGDADTDNIYALVVTATATAADGVTTQSATQDVEITVTDVDEPTVGAVRITNASRAGETPRAGDTLEADTTALADGDGIGTFTYQWQRGGAAIAGATGARYDTGAADVDEEIGVAVVHTDASGNRSAPIVAAAVRIVDNADNNVGVPVFTSAAAVRTPENGVATGYGAVATADPGTLSYAITGGADAARFAIDASSGVVTFRAAPDYEAPGDADTDNIYALVVTATATAADGVTTQSATQDVEITVTDVDEPTVGAVRITNASRAGETPRAGDTLEADTTALADGDGIGTFTYQWQRGGAAIAGATGARYDTGAADVDEEIGVAVVHTDASGNRSAPIVAAAVRIVDNADNNVGVPVFTSAAAVRTPENGVATGYGAVATADPGTLSYAITGGGDAARFAIDASSGVVTFRAAPDYEAPGDADTDNIYALVVTATATAADGVTTQSATQDVEITVTDVDEPTVGAVRITNASRAGETPRAGDTLEADTTALADGDGIGTFTYQWQRGGAAIAGATGARYDTGAADVDEEIGVAVVHTDASGNRSAPIVAAAVRIVDNADNNVGVPVFTSAAAVSTAENGVATGYGAVAAADPGTLSYAITGGADAARFAIDASSGVVRFRAAPDYEAPGDADTDNTYALVVTATATAADGVTTQSATQDVEITVTDVDEPTVGAVRITNASRAGETPREGDTLEADTTALADGDGIGTFTYQWQRGGAAIAGATGARYDTGAADVDEEIGVAVVHTDASGNRSAPIVAAAVRIVDNADNNVGVPVFTSAAAVSTAENGVATGYGAVAAADPGTLSYAITGGADAARFAIDASSGVVRFRDAPDYEGPGDADTDNIYALVVTATATAADGVTTQSATQDVEITVTDVDEPTAGAVRLTNASRAGETPREGDTLEADTTALADGDGIGTFTYQWQRGGAAIAGATEARYDTGAADVDEEIGVAVVHTDASGNRSAPIVAAAVRIVDNADNNVGVPVFTSAAAVSTAENGVATGYGAVAAADPGTLSYAITGGADAARFAIDASSGVVRFRDAPDYEGPGDADTDNIYALVVTATATAADGVTTQSATQDVEITVTDVDEPTAGAVRLTNASRAGETPREGDTLEADTTALADGDGIGTFTYQWQRGGAAIAGATGARYDTGAADVDEEIGVAVVHTDASGNRSAPIVAAAVRIVDNADNNVGVPVFTSAAAVRTPENGVATGYGAVATADPGTLSYAITGGGDAARFAIDASSGVVTFRAAPDYEAPGDADTDNTYALVVTATATAADGVTTQSATQDVEITVTDVDEPTVGAVRITNASRAGETPREGDTLEADTTALADGDGLGTFTYQWQRDGAAIAGATEARYSTGAADVDEEIRVTLTHTDASGNRSAPIVAAAVRIVDNADNNVGVPVFTSAAAVSTAENGVATGYGAAAAADPGTLSYAITGGADAARFAIDASSGVVTFRAAPDYEAPGDADTDNIYALVVTATATAADGVTTQSATQDVEITVTDVDEPTVGAVRITNASRAGETPREGDTLEADTTALADGDGLGTFTYQWQRDGAAIAGATEARYDTGAADVDEEIRVTLTHTDARGNRSAPIVAAAVRIVAAPETTVGVPVFTSAAAVRTPENGVATGYGAVATADPGTLSYAITGGADAARFAIDASSGVVTFRAAPDYEGPGDADTDNIYALVVTATATAADGVTTQSATQDVEITVTDVDEPTAGAVRLTNASRAGETPREGDTLEADTTALADGDGIGTFTYQWQRDGAAIAGATEARYSTGAADVDEEIRVTLTHTDASGNRSAPIVAAAVRIVDNADNNVGVPVFTSAAAVSTAENGVATGYGAAAAADPGTLSYAITGGADAARFAIDASSGVVTFRAAPDYEAPGDADTDNIYALVVTATATAADGVTTQSATQDVEITVTDVDEPTVGAVRITNASRAGETPREGDTLEADTTALADGDGLGTFTYQWQRDGAAIAGATEARYDTGAADVDEEIRVTLTHTDARGNRSAPIVAAAVRIVAAPETTVGVPVFTSAAAVRTPENGVATGYGAVATADPGTLSYAITGGADAARFAIDASSGVVTFRAAPDYEGPGDADTDNIYALVVTATATAADGVTTQSATQDVEITVTDVDEPTVGAVRITNASRAGETPREGDTLEADTTALADGDGLGTFTYQWQRDGAAIAGATEARYDTGAADVDEEIRVTLTHTDARGNRSAPIVAAAVRIVAAPETTVGVPVFTSAAAVRTPENGVATGYGAVATADPGTLSYAITGGADAARFAIDASSGVVTFRAAPDYEAPGDADTDNIYALVVTATATAADGVTTQSATQDVEITVTDVDEPTVGAVRITNASRAGETPREGDTLEADTTALADGDGLGTFTYQWQRDGAAIAGATEARYSTGAADVDEEIRVTLTHTDASGNRSAPIVAAAVRIVDNADNNVGVPVFTSAAAVRTPENGVATGYGAVATADPGTLSYAITGGADAARFAIDASSGVVTFRAAPDYEAPGDADTDNIYALVVTATATAADGVTTQSATQDVEITVTDVDEPTVGAVRITNASRAGETPRAGDTLEADTTALADGDGLGTFTYQWQRDGAAIAGATEARYSTGAADVDEEIRVTLTHTDASGNRSAPIVAAAVRIVDNADNNVGVPVFTSAAAVSTAENGVATGYGAAAAADPGTLSYAITGGADAARFAIDASSGVVTFRAAPDYEAPGDADTDNIYALVVTATATAADGVTTQSATQDVEITVTDVDEPTVGAVRITNASRAGETPREGDTLEADTTALADGDGLGTFTYQWQRDGVAIAGATEARYSTGAADVDEEIRVTLTHTDARGNRSAPIVAAAVRIVAAPQTTVGVPVFTSAAAVRTPENGVATGYGAVATADPGTLSYAITGGGDAARFAIDASSGVVTFRAAPDYEAPGDADTDNIYALVVTATATAADGVTTQSATQDVEITVTDVDEIAPTVVISGPPAITGIAPFDVAVRFSEPVSGFELAEVAVGNGAASNLRGSGAVYTVAITPDSGGDVTIDVAENVARDVAGNGNIAAPQVRVVYIVSPEIVRLAVSPERVGEGAGPSKVVVTATVEGQDRFVADTDFIVTVGGAGDTATAGIDYKDVVAFRLTIPARRASATTNFLLEPLDDRLDELEETISVTARRADAARGAQSAVSTVTARITLVDDDDPAVEVIGPALVRFGRTVGEQSVEAITKRIDADLVPGFSGQIAGQTIQPCAPAGFTSEVGPLGPSAGRGDRRCGAEIARQATDPLQVLLNAGRGSAGTLSGIRTEPDATTPEGRQAIADTAFTLTSDMDNGGRLGLWAGGALSRFGGTAEDVNLTGEVVGVQLGTDWRRDKRLVGLMLSQSHGDITYRYTTDPGAEGRIEADLTALVPYASLEITDRLEGWAALGYGWGHMTFMPEGEPERQASINWKMGAAGLKGSLIAPEGESGFGLDVTADVLYTRTASGALSATGTQPALGSTTGTTQRLRFGLESRWERSLVTGGTFTPHFGLAMRHDDGDAETGWGLEVGGGFGLADPHRGLELEASGRALALHEDGNFRNWGLSLLLVWNPDPDTKRGWSARLRTDLGDPTSGGPDALLSPTAFPSLTDTDDGTARWSLETAYGFTLGKGLVGSPHGALSGESGSIDRAQLGYRIEADAPHARDMGFDLWAEPSFRDGDDRAGLSFNLRW
ncbi:Ig-like domain-containing protein [Ruegeria sp.]|uniref:Ig-like domain-containing protein n=1 Tax=Ruegeria sp. TaxID=1879320 RepID=UPI003B00CF7F